MKTLFLLIFVVLNSNSINLYGQVFQTNVDGVVHIVNLIKKGDSISIDFSVHNPSKRDVLISFDPRKESFGISFQFGACCSLIRPIPCDLEKIYSFSFIKVPPGETYHHVLCEEPLPDFVERIIICGSYVLMNDLRRVDYKYASPEHTLSVVELRSHVFIKHGRFFSQHIPIEALD